MSANQPISPPDMRQFLEQLRKLVLDEAITTRQQIHQRWSKPLATRVEEGYAIEDIRIEQVHKSGHIECTCSRNRSRFREGDMLCLNRSNPFMYPNFMVTLEVDDGDKLVLSGDSLDINWGDITAGSGQWVLDEGHLDLSQIILDALNIAGDSHVGRQRILPLLMNPPASRIDDARYERGLDIGDGMGLNWQQKEALAHAYATSLTYLIQGPPGTGKTLVLAHLAQALVHDGERVFITGFTHRAINNALNKLSGVGPDVPAIKIGPASRADDLHVANYETFHESPLRDQAGGYVVGATPFAPYTKRMLGVEFDTVIFDEASQITLPLAIMGMLTANKYIFFGDQQQLPPVLVTKRGINQLRDSVFGHLVGHDVDKMLEITYRLNQELTAWPSKHFYAGALQPSEGAANRRVNYPRPPHRLLDILEPDSPLVFWDMGQVNTTTYSYREAQAVTDLILNLFQCGFPLSEIGVVAPYRAQGRLIRNLLQEAIPEPVLRRQIVVDTVERMQGQERDVIILSLTTSSNAFAERLADFFFQPQRLNVAVTRARSKLIIVGSRHILQTQTADPDQQETVALLADLLARCDTIMYPM